MATKIGVIRGSTEQEVKSKKFNLYVGVSLGNKWFTKEHIREHLLWCLKYTKDRVAFLLADTLHTINYVVRNKESPEKAKQKALRKGDKIVLIFKEIIKELPEDQQKKIDIVRWEDIKKNTETRKILPFLYKEFHENPAFRKKVLDIVKSFTEHTKDKFSEQDLNSLARYVIEELPELFNGFFYEGTYYNCYTYPEDSPINQLTEKIQKKELFPEFHEKLNIKNNIFVELGVIDERNNSIYIANTKDYGKGLFANKDIKRGEIVLILKGPILKKPTIYTIPIGHNSYLDDSEFGKYLNHSCNPNCGIKNKINVVAMKDIKKGEEITIDYAMVVDKYGEEITEKQRKCKCKSKNCRGKLGAYNELPNKLKKKYKGFISDYLIEKTN